MNKLARCGLVALALLTVLLGTPVAFGSSFPATANSLYGGTRVYAASDVAIAQEMYVDKKLGFSLQLPVGWVATPFPGRLNKGNADVVFTNVKAPGTRIEVGVMRSLAAAADFALRGKAALSIGGYPAFRFDSRGGRQVALPCLARSMLAHDDVVLASWCARDASAHVGQFESILATYRYHAVVPLHAHVAPQVPVGTVQTCAQVMQNPGPNMWGYLPPSGDQSFGVERVNPFDATWTTHFGEGVAVCDDFYSGGNSMWENSYLFQCVELANRFINEEWGLMEFTVDAFAYYDNYQGGTFYQGQARSFFGNQVQLIDDASQGYNTTPPVPGDLLIFQDVTDGVSWTSGELSWDPGHVVVVTSVTGSTVTVVQQNWHTGETHQFALEHGSYGYHVVDNSGWYHRITRGWIHFSANGGTVLFPASNAVGRMLVRSAS